MTAKKKARPSNEPQHLHGQPDNWYYETRGGIQVVTSKDGVSAIAKLPWTNLAKSAKRCGWRLSRV